MKLNDTAKKVAISLALTLSLTTTTVRAEPLLYQLDAGDTIALDSNSILVDRNAVKLTGIMHYDGEWQPEILTFYYNCDRMMYEITAGEPPTKLVPIPIDDHVGRQMYNDACRLGGLVPSQVVRLPEKGWHPPKQALSNKITPACASELKIGTTTTQCALALFGKPGETAKHMGSLGVTEKWSYYRQRLYLTFENGLLTHASQFSR